MDIQERCARGQELLQRQGYIEAEKELKLAEREATARHDWDSLSRLYMPLQEARRQRRLRCGEGEVCLDLLATGPDDLIQGQQIIDNYPHGQLLVAGWASIEPALEVRRLQPKYDLYVEVLLGAVYPLTGGKTVVAIVPDGREVLPDARPRSVDALRELLPKGSLIIPAGELPTGSRRGNAASFGRIEAMWERLHRPYLTVADAMEDPLRRIEAYRHVIEIDYACELAHQNLAGAARGLARHAVMV